MCVVLVLGRFLGVLVISILIVNQNPLISFGKYLQIHKNIIAMGGLGILQ